MTMPRRQRRRHFEPPWRGDRPWAIATTRRGRALDVNYQCSADGTAWAGHSPTPAACNWHLILSAGRVRRMTKRELHRPFSAWHDDEIRRWRRSHQVHGPRPATYREMCRVAARHGVVMYAELKWHITQAQADRMVAEAKAEGARPYAMAELRQRRAAPTTICEDKCAHWTVAGGEFRLIYGPRLLGLSNRRLARRVVPTWDHKPAAFG